MVESRSVGTHRNNWYVSNYVNAFLIMAKAMLEKLHNPSQL